jgi:nitrate reductase cytochrome c-type subunit
LISSASGNKTAVTFTASNMLVNTPAERAEVAKINTHCISCHSDQNNDTTPFGDCKTPRQYAWDKQSIDARYSQNATTSWGKYAATTNAAKKGFTKALSAHGNATLNQGGWNATTGLDAINPATDNSRGGAYGVQCFDCHNSHGSAVEGVTSSYLNYTGVKNGGNLKETQKNKGGYKVRYMAKSNPDATFNNPYNAGAGQCFDCHLTVSKGETDGSTPWGYNSTFGATKPIKGYKDAYRFGERKAPDYLLLSFKNDKTVLGGHLKRSTEVPLEKTTNGTIDGLCTPCHDPHGVSPTLGANKSYAVPLLKGTYMTSPYKEDWPAPDPTGTYITSQNGVPISWGRYQGHPSPTQPYIKYWLDNKTFGGSTRLSETADKFAGLCLSCHPKENLTDGINKNTVFRSVDRVHESVKGWGENKEHSYSCSKCHQPHQSGLPRLMQTNCLDYQHRGNRPSGGRYWNADKQVPSTAHAKGEHRGYPKVDNGTGTVPPATESTTACHIGAPNNQRAYPDGNYWNQKTPWPVIP